MKDKMLIKRIILGAVAGLLAVVLIVSNCILSYYSLILNRFFAGDDADVNTDVLKAADLTVQEAAEDSMVLLTNVDGYLPKKDLTKVNLFGYGATDNGFLLTGGGSGGTSITDEKSIKLDLTDAFEKEGIEYNAELTKAYEGVSNVDADYRSKGSTGANAVESLINPSKEFYTSDLMTKAKGYSSVAVAVISRWGAENGGDQELKSIGKYTNGSFLELTAEEIAMFDKLQEFNFEVIVVLNVCNNIELGFLNDYSCIKACIYAGIPGQSGTIAIPRIITGTVNPSGRMSDTLPYDYQTYNPVYANATKTGSDLVYEEGIYFGYKWYETADADGYFDSVDNEYGKGYDGVVQFPFGYGLSYSKFTWTVTWFTQSELSADGEYTVKVNVYNDSEVAGRDVVQLYGHAPYTDGKIEKAERVLLDFAKTPEIQPHQSEQVELTFTAYDLASYDDYDKNGNGKTGYELDAGNYVISVMTNAHQKVNNLEKTMRLTTGVYYENDPVSGEPVGNLFTGNNAYANCPIDGSTAFTNAPNYLSRANKFANFPDAFTGASKVSAAVTDYRYTGYDGADVSNIAYGEDMALRLMQIVGDDGATSFPNELQLNGEDTSVEMSFNKDLLEYLCDYDSEMWDYFLNQMSEDEIKSLIGEGGFQTKEIVSLGKPRCADKDGPAGFNNNVSNPGKSSEYTLLPSESLIGCSWDKALAAKIGESQAKEGNSAGINGWYGPGVNLHRSVYNSRNYEYFSEDAVLSGKLAAEIISSAKENNLYCYIKHFAVSEAGQNPKNLNTWLTEQALRESYLRPFEIAVKVGKANAVMSAFNRVGAVLSGYNHALLTDVLREEWGFKGSVITDWYQRDGYMNSHTIGVLAGNDLWLCGTTSQAADIDLSDPAVAYAARQSVKNLLYTFVDTYQTATTIKVTAEPTSALFVTLWTLIDVVLVAGIAVCATFLVLSFVKKPKEQETHV